VRIVAEKPLYHSLVSFSNLFVVTEEPIFHKPFTYINRQLKFYEQSPSPPLHGWLSTDCQVALTFDDVLHWRYQQRPPIVFFLRLLLNPILLENVDDNSLPKTRRKLVSLHELQQSPIIKQQKKQHFKPYFTSEILATHCCDSLVRNDEIWLNFISKHWNKDKYLYFIQKRT